LVGFELMMIAGALDNSQDLTSKVCEAIGDSSVDVSQQA
jgi:hypothetical protein